MSMWHRFDVYGPLLLLNEAREHGDAHRERREAPLEGFEVLEGEHCCRCEDGHLLAVAQRLEGGTHGDFSFAEAHVATEQAVHWIRRFHVALDLFGGGDLIFRFRELEGVFKFALPVRVPWKR